VKQGDLVEQGIRWAVLDMGVNVFEFARIWPLMYPPLPNLADGETIPLLNSGDAFWLGGSNQDDHIAIRCKSRFQ
jgi:hypothetical protein